MPAPPNFNSVATATLQNVNGEVVDNIYNAFPMLAKMRAEGGFKTRTGGKRIDVNIVWQTQDTAGAGAQSFSGYDQVNVQPAELFTNSFANWKNIHVPVTFSEEEVAQNRGKAEIFNMIAEKKKIAIREGQNKLTTVLFSDGTGNGGKDPSGLKDIIRIDPTTSTAVQNINQSTYSVWRNKANANIDAGITGSALTSTSTVSATAYFNRIISNQRNNCSRGSALKSERPNLGITTQVLFETYKNSLLDKVRYPGDGSNAKNLGTDEYVMFEGMPIIWDPALSTETINSITGTSRIYLINTNYLNVVTDEGYDWKQFPFMSPVDQYASVGKMMWRGNLIVTDRSRQGVVSGFTTNS